jgi:threonine dehydrogenase-like Zn-dependent dehydrogenase
VNLCHHKRNLSHLDWGGSFAEYVLLEPAMAYTLPAGLDPVLGALVEPLSIGLHAVNLVWPADDRSLAVIGSGGIGLSALVTAKRLGFGPTVCVDTGPHKEKLTLALGADGYLDTAATDLVAGTAEVLGGLADVTVVAAGYPGAIADAAAVTRPGGRLVVVSYFDGPQSIELNTLVGKELSVHFSALSTVVDFERVIGWLGEGSIDPLPMVTHRLPLREAERAMRLLSRPGQVGKIVLEVEA